MASEDFWRYLRDSNEGERFDVPSLIPPNANSDVVGDLLSANFNRKPDPISPDLIAQLQQEKLDADTCSLPAELDCVRRKGLLPISFEEGGEEPSDLPLCGEVLRTFDTALDALPLSSEKFYQYPPKRPKPDISKGLGKQQIKRELIELANYIKSQLQLLVQKGVLFVFVRTHWNRMDSEKASIFLRAELNRAGYGEYLLPQDINRIQDLLLTDPELQHDEPLDPPEHVLNLADCSYDILADRYYPHDLDDMFTSFIDITSTDFRSPEPGIIFEQFATQAGDGDPLVRTQLLELVALALLGTEVKAFYVMLGPSNTGKSQFGRFLMELVGRENVESIRSIDDFKDKWTTGALVDKRLATCLDLPNSTISSNALATLKQLVGDDAIKTERKRKEPLTIFRKPLLGIV